MLTSLHVEPVCSQLGALLFIHWQGRACRYNKGTGDESQEWVHLEKLQPDEVAVHISYPLDGQVLPPASCYHHAVPVVCCARTPYP